MATPKGGYDCDFVNDPPKILECTICLLTLRDPHVISCCGNHFCRPCVERVQRDRKPCPLCNDPNFTVFLHKGVMREISTLLVRCPQKELGCGWEGELGQLQRHLDPGAGLSERGCAFVEVECVYECGGRCLRSELHGHELETCPRRPVEMVMASIVKRLDALTVENQEIKAENQQLKDSLATKAEVTQLSDATAKELKLCAKTRDVNKRLSLIPPFYFTMCNYEHFKSVDYDWNSEPFYTHHGGYKMRVDVHPNGWGRGKGTHLSLYVCIKRGENDDNLQWPFRGSVTVQAYNRQTEAWDNDYTVRFNDTTDPECCKKPKADRISISSWGKSLYIANYDIKCYAKQGAIRFRVYEVDL